MSTGATDSRLGQYVPALGRHTPTPGAQLPASGLQTPASGPDALAPARDSAAPDPQTPTPEQLARMLELYKTGQCMAAYAHVTAIGDLRRWQGPDARVLAGRLARSLGSPRLGFHLHRMTWRAYPDHPLAAEYGLYAVELRHGPLDALEQLDAFVRRNSTRTHPAAFHTIRARMLAGLRDFEAAERALAQADDLAPGDPWTAVTRAMVLRLEDRFEASLEALEEMLEQDPWYRPAIQMRAALLVELGRDGEAIDFLEAAETLLECCDISAQLATVYHALERWDAETVCLDRYAARAPMLAFDRSQRFWLAERRAGLAYLRGDLEAAATFASSLPHPRMQQLAERLRDPATGRRRVLLPVPYVQQHHLTCVPATLTALSRYWQRPAAHLEVAEQICYDGTSAWSERRWAEDNGFVAREFEVTTATARALIDAGIPFTLATVEPGNGHMQAVIGYDTCLETLILREPSCRNVLEAVAETLLTRQAATGPRGMAIVPIADQARLEALELPAAGLYDLLYQMEEALARHDRAQAVAMVEQLAREAPGHRLTLHTRRTLARYDGDASGQLEQVERLLALHPDDRLLELERVSLLSQVSRRDARLELLGHLAARPDAGAHILLMYGQTLAVDARQHDRAIRLLRRAIRSGPQEAGGYYTLAEVLWRQRRFAEALDLYRYAVCLRERDAMLAARYASAAMYLNRGDEALQFLRARFARFGRKSGEPARTLATALSALDRTAEALVVLQQALELRPDDGELLLFAARWFTRIGDETRGQALLDAGADRAQRRHWLTTAAELAERRGDLAGALEHWLALGTLDPLSPEAQAATARLLASTRGLEAAVAHLEAVAHRFPYAMPLYQLLIGLVREAAPDRLEAVLRACLEHNPDDAWLHRELALVFGAAQRFDEAFAELELAGHLEPYHPAQYNVRGSVLAAAGRRDEAEAMLRTALSMDVDNAYGIESLVELCETPARKQEALRFVRQQLADQTAPGDGLVAFHVVASAVLEPAQVLEAVDALHAARPDLWQSWWICIAQRLRMGRATEALEVAIRATDTFSLLPLAWLERAKVHRALAQRDDLIAALETALRIDPDLTDARMMLIAEHVVAGDMPAARLTLENGTARNPLNPQLQVAWSDLHWRSGAPEAAVEALERAVALEPGLAGAWQRLKARSASIDQPERARRAAEVLTGRRPGEARSWLLLAEQLSEAGEVLRALDRAVALAPRDVHCWHLRARCLVEIGRHDEALEACRPPVFGAVAPTALRVEAARIEAARGHKEKAIALTRQALVDDPMYLEGWESLGELCLVTHDLDGALEAADRLVAVAPAEATSWGFRGEMHRHRKETDAAMADFSRALALDPTSYFALERLFDLQLERRNWAEATALLTKSETWSSPASVVHRRLRLALAQGDDAAAADGVQALCRSPGGDLDLFRAALERIAEKPALKETWEAEVVEPGASRLALAARVERLCLAGAFSRAQSLIARLPDASPGRALAEDVLAFYLKTLREQTSSTAAPGSSGPSSGIAGSTWIYGVLVFLFFQVIRIACN